MASLLAARRQHSAATLGFHAYAEAVRLGASASARLKCALWQTIPLCSTPSRGSLFHPQRQNSPLASSAAGFEFLSVFDPSAQGQESGRGESDTPWRVREMEPIRRVANSAVIGTPLLLWHHFSFSCV